MPRYDYRCPTCRKTDEVEIKISVVDLKVFFCVDCGTEMKRVLTAPGLIFKGTGWAGTTDRPPTTTEKSS